MVQLFGRRRAVRILQQTRDTFERVVDFSLLLEDQTFAESGHAFSDKSNQNVFRTFRRHVLLLVDTQHFDGGDMHLLLIEMLFQFSQTATTGFLHFHIFRRIETAHNPVGGVFVVS